MRLLALAVAGGMSTSKVLITRARALVAYGPNIGSSPKLHDSERLRMPHDALFNRLKSDRFHVDPILGP